MNKSFYCGSGLLLLSSCASVEPQLPVAATKQQLTVASFNVSMEANNYGTAPQQPSVELLKQHLASGTQQQIANVARIIQLTRPDVVLLNEFDYIESQQQGIGAFINNYLAVSQAGSEPIDYPYVYLAPSNTGLPTEFDLDNDGVAAGVGADAHGYGLYYGHYAMVLLSKYPIDYAVARTFAQFRWADMPAAAKPIEPSTGQAFYPEHVWRSLRLSSKSHWDVPVKVGDKTVHILASHPTPPVFDGPEDRNGARNHDEIRFWADYIGVGNGDYIYDDNQRKGGLAKDAAFVIVGDLNASTTGGNARPAAIASLLQTPLINNSVVPMSEGGRLNKPDDATAACHTATWGMRADYVLPSAHFAIDAAQVFWPTGDDADYYLVQDRAASSDHRLVWLTLSF